MAQYSQGDDDDLPGLIATPGGDPPGGNAMLVSPPHEVAPGRRHSVTPGMQDGSRSRAGVSSALPFCTRLRFACT